MRRVLTSVTGNMTLHFELSYTDDDDLENVLVCALSRGGFTEEGGRKGVASNLYILYIDHWLQQAM